MNMKAKWFLIPAIVVALLALPPGVPAQTPVGTALTYQGQLKEGGGLFNGYADFEFTLWDAATTPPGVQVGPPVLINNVEVVRGLFRVTVDFGPDIFKDEARWLEIKVNVGSGWETLTPRQELAPTPYALALPGLWTQQNPTSPNVIAGQRENSVEDDAVGAAIGGGGDPGALGDAPWPNKVTDDYCTVGGGAGNQAGNADADPKNATHATVGGGRRNTASASDSTVAGGVLNIVSARDATVGGGTQNEASGIRATVAGGGYSVASGISATVAGGYRNTASGSAATVAGGQGNEASEWNATVAGGRANVASGDGAFVAGGWHNTAAGERSFAGGSRARAMHSGTFVWNSYGAPYFESTGTGQFLINARGGVGIGTNTPQANLDVRGTARVEVLEISGGADLAEKFPVSEEVQPGVVVAIDPEHPGQLCLARGAYNRCVAGVVSGANGSSAGAVLGNLPGKEDTPPIALSGRVWVYCDATDQPIQPGDLLTTSDTPGHAMKASDHAKAQGAIIGKAMTVLDSGQGLVLVLVSLQ